MTIVAIGPLTNLFLGGNEKSRHPQKSQRKCVGGTFFCSGKVTPHAEFNIWFNAEAAQTLFDSRDDIVEKDKSPS